MVIVLVGDSGAGKSTIENELAAHYGYKKIISYTTRTPRDKEENGKDYWFVPYDVFKETLEKGLFAEYEEYSQQRFYGSLKSDYIDGDVVAVLTPNGLRQLKRTMPSVEVFVVYVKANLGTRVKRYIDRCGVDKFNFDDKNEIAARVERDAGMFFGIIDEVDLVVENNEGANIKEIAEVIVNSQKTKIQYI